jgi:hypothetical protein
MKEKNAENINELLAQFLSDTEASKAADDIIVGENILDSNPAPQPSPALLENIKHRMAAEAASQNRHWRHRLAWEFAAAAAVVVIVLWAGMAVLKTTEDTGQFAQLSESFWQESPENAIESRITQIEGPETDTTVITLEVNRSRESTAISDVTSELDEIGNSFWEG